MNCAQAQTIPITEYLAWRGYFPVYCHSGGTEYSYHSSVRQGNDKSPSFDVDIIKNVWNDFAWQGSSSTGGDIVKLVCDLESAGISEALNILDASGLYQGIQSYTPPYVELRKSDFARSPKKASAYSIHSEL